MLSFTTIDGRIYRTIKFSIFPIRLEFHLWSNTKGHCWKTPTLPGTYYISGKPYLFSKLLAINKFKNPQFSKSSNIFGKINQKFLFFYFYNTQTKREKRYQTQQSSSWLWTQWKTISCTYSFYTWWKRWDFLVSTAFNIKNF